MTEKINFRGKLCRNTNDHYGNEEGWRVRKKSEKKQERDADGWGWSRGEHIKNRKKRGKSTITMIREEVAHSQEKAIYLLLVWPLHSVLNWGLSDTTVRLTPVLDLWRRSCSNAVVFLMENNRARLNPSHSAPPGRQEEWDRCLPQRAQERWDTSFFLLLLPPLLFHVRS